MNISIFNDVLGPIMRGPSSSHTAASVRIGMMAKNLLGKGVEKGVIEFSPDGSLATTYHSQGSDIGIVAGLIGIDMISSDILNSLTIAQERGIDIRFIVSEYENNHPNTYKMSVGNGNDILHLTAISVGGGMIEVIEIEGAKVSMDGTYYELLIFSDLTPDEAKKRISRMDDGDLIDKIEVSSFGEMSIINVKSSNPRLSQLREEITTLIEGKNSYFSPPIMPVLSGKSNIAPFTSVEEMSPYIKEGMQLWELGLKYEMIRGNLSEDEVLSLAKEVYNVMKESVANGLAGTEYKDRILGQQSHLIDIGVRKGRLIADPIVNAIIRNTMAVMESKSSFGLIVAAPTAGSCAAIPGTLVALAEQCGFTDEECVKGLLAIGLIGAFIASRSTFAAEVAGCQAECGSSSGMLAAGVVQLMGGDAKTAVDSASFALQNILGMVCDPVGNRVEVPCLGKNIMCALNGFSAANICLAGVNAVVPLDEVIVTMDSVGRSIPYELRCTGYGGLSVTPTSRKIADTIDL